MNNFNYDNEKFYDFQIALSKFSYELNLRKKEFISECLKYDHEFSSKISKIYFDIVIDHFTSYLKSNEKELLKNHFLVNNNYLNYIEISNLKHPPDEYSYKDPFLNHLNKIKSENKNLSQLPSINLKKVARLVDITPIELLNCEISEENFLIKIAKKILDFILLNSQNNKLEEIFNKLFKQFDYDTDNKFTIGELGNFLKYIGLELGDYDLRYFFESFKLENGKIQKQLFYEFYLQNSSKNYKDLVETNFSKSLNEIFKDEELFDFDQIHKILNENRFVTNIKESLEVFGISFIMKYFSKYYEVTQNNIFLDSVWLELGYKYLGYKEVSPKDLGEFKFLLVKRNIAIVKSDATRTININLNMLFDFITNEFQIQEMFSTKDSSKLLESISRKMFKDISDNLLSYSQSKKFEKSGDVNNFYYDPTIPEFEFRKKFINNFGFTDHHFLNHLVDKLNTNDKLNKLDAYDSNKKVFSLEDISSKKWLNLSYNFLFLGLIKFHDQFGLMLELDEVLLLKRIYDSIENKIFKDDIGNKNLFNSKVNQLNINRSNQYQGQNQNLLEDENNIEGDKNLFTDKFLLKDRDKESEIIQKKRASNIPPQSKLITNILNMKSDSTKISIKENINKSNIIKSIPNNLSTNTINSNNVNVNDTPNIIPELFNFCANYLKTNFKLEVVDYKILSKLGCCKIFRDHLNSAKIDFSIDINCLLLMSHLKTISCMTDTIYKFLEFYSSRYKNKNNLVNVSFFFKKLEDILLEYSKINIR